MLFTKGHNTPTMPTKKLVSNTKKQGSAENGNNSPRLHFPSLFRQNAANTAPVSPRKRVGLDDEVLKKNRKTVDNYLHKVGALIHKRVSLNSEGMGYFSFEKFVVVIEVPADSSGEIFIYTMVCRLGPSDNAMLVLQRAMELNYMGFGTRGSILGLEGEEVNLCLSCPVSSLTASKLQSKVESFLQTAVEVNRELDAVKKIKSTMT